MPDHIERRRNLWYAILTVPKDAREAVGKLRFVQSLGTPSRPEAKRRAAPLLAKWYAEIEAARGRGDAVVQEAMRWRDALATPSTHRERDVMTELLAERARDIVESRGAEAAQSFYGIASGQHTPTGLHFDQWLADLQVVPKSADQMKKDVGAMVKRFPVLEQITRKDARKWLVIELHASSASAERIASFSRNYWRYLQAIHVAPEGDGPFTKLDLKTGTSAGDAPGSWLPFTPDEVATLWEAAASREDYQLADLIALASYLGARIEEVCGTKLASIKDDVLHIADSKTTAGVRDVPIHSALKPLIARLRKSSKDGYLLAGLTQNKYGDRSNGIGKRFGRLKAALGFSRRHVFHSLRKCLVTQLENAGVSENVCADIVGHDKPRITYGLYSGGATIEVKRKAIEKVRYSLKPC